MAFKGNNWTQTAAGFRDFWTNARDSQILGSADAINNMASNMGINLGDWYGQMSGMYDEGFNLQKAIRNGFAMAPTDVQTALFNQQLSRQMYDDTQSYGAQVQQMLDAGLNPALMYAGGSSNTGGAQAGQAEVSDFSPVDGVGIFSQLFQQMANMASTVSSIKLQNAQANNLNADTAGKEITNKNSQRRFDDEHALAQSQIKLNDENANGVKVQSYLNEQRIQTEKWATLEKEYQSKIASIDADKRAEILQAQLDLNAALEQMYRDSSSEIKAKIRLYGFQEDLMTAQVKELRARVINLGKQNELIEVQKKNTKKQTDMIDENYFLSYIGTLCDWMNANTVVANASSQYGGAVDVAEVYQNAITTGFESVRNRFGNKGYYTGSGSNIPYPVMQPPQYKKNGKVKDLPMGNIWMHTTVASGGHNSK